MIDASALVVALVDDGADGDMVRARLRGEELAAPELLDLEIASVLRRHVMSGTVDAARAGQAIVDLLAMPLTRAQHRSLVVRAWELRSNLTIYDGAYVALAEALRTSLLTADRRLAGAPGVRCAVEVITPGPTADRPPA